MSEIIGQKLKHLRKSKKLTQQEVSERVNIKRSTISNYEIGRRTPHLKDLQKMAKMYGVGLEYFNITTKDEVFELLTRAKEVFESDDIKKETKEDLFNYMMELYLELKRQ